MRDEKYLTPHALECWHKLRDAYQTVFPDRKLILTCTHRPQAEQIELYKKGRDADGNIVDKNAIVTYCDGVTKLSQHNYCPSPAFDVAVVVGGKTVWDEKYYQPLGVLAEGLDRLAWGGNWKRIKDYPHFEVLG